MKKTLQILFIFIAFNACKEEATPLVFFEDNFTSEEFATIEVNIPKVENPSDVGNKINTTVETFVANALSLNEDSTENASIKDSALKLDVEYQLFTEEFSETPQPWEAFVDGEVTYQSAEIICVALNSYLNTGGAHGNSVISFLNFNPSNGELYKSEDLINNLNEFTLLTKKHFKKAIEEKITDFTFENNFKLPETIGFSEDGVIILFNTYEIAAYADGILEFTIPYEEANRFLNIN